MRQPKGSIIVVDDDPAVRQSIVRALREEGYEAIAAENGRQALDLTARREFDLVFLDIAMPGLNGLDVLTIMTAGRPRTPVVIMTGQTHPDIEFEALNRQACAFLRKPCHISDIIEVAQRLVDHPTFSSKSSVSKRKIASSKSGHVARHDLEAFSDTLKSVIVADDDASVRRTIHRALSREGYYVELAEDGQDVLERIQKRHFDLLFLDILMPGISGLEVLAAVARQHPATKVVVLTAVDSEQIRSRAMENMPVAYLTKPCHLSEVIEIANNVLRNVPT